MILKRIDNSPSLIDLSIASAESVIRVFIGALLDTRHVA